MSTVKVSAMSSDREFKGTLEDRGKVSLEFRRLAYEYYKENVLAGQLAELAERLTSGCREGRRRAAIAKGLEIDEEPHWNAAVRRFRAERDRLPVSFTSPSGDITLSCTGLRDWVVTVKQGAIRRLSEAEFSNEVGLAAAGVWLKYRHAVALLRAEEHEAAGAPRT